MSYKWGNPEQVGFEEVYYQTLQNLNDFGTVVSPRGRATKEIIGYQMIIRNIRKRIIGFKSRKLNIYYAIGNFLWVMAQSNKLDFINYYNPRGESFSDDGVILPGAYGKRIFDIDGVNQYYQAIKELKVDPDSRRATISIHMAQHDWRGVLDTPCTNGFQFFIRNNKLIMVNSMRSQSGAMVMPYDIFLMTMLQEYAANELGVEVGHYIHNCNSLHYYLEEQSIVDNILEDKLIDIEMDPMPKGDNSKNLKSLLKFERELREETEISMYHPELEVEMADWIEKAYNQFEEDYWYQIALILIAKSMNQSFKKTQEEYIWNHLILPKYQPLKK